MSTRWSRLVGLAVLGGALMGAPAGAGPVTEVPPEAGAAVPSEARAAVPLSEPPAAVPAPAPARSRPPAALGAADLPRLDGLLESLLENYPEIFGDFDREGVQGMQADRAVEVFARVLDRIRRVDPSGRLDSSPVPLDEESLEEALALLRGLSAAVQSGDLQRGRLDPSVGRVLPREAVKALEALPLQPAQVQQLQRLLQEVGPAALSGSTENLRRLQVTLPERLRKVFTPAQLEALREAERLMRTKSE